MKTLHSLFLATSLALAACGANDERDQTPANNGNVEQAPTSVEAQPALPTAAVVRVPVDANGVEDSSKAEMRLDQSESATATQEGIVAAWEKGQAVEALKSQDELDGDSSRQSWFFFRGGHGGYGRGYGRGYGYGYYPGYNYYGNNYYYNSYPSYYGYGGYNYYYYRRPYGC